MSAAGSFAATEFAAEHLGYPQQLGHPVTMAGLHLYAPWAWMAWDSDFGPYAPAIFQTVKVIGWSALLGAWVPVVLAALVIGRRRPSSTAHGSAKWGIKTDLE